jgi:hypothetical protein
MKKNIFNRSLRTFIKKIINTIYSQKGQKSLRFKLSCKYADTNSIIGLRLNMLFYFDLG